LPHIKGGQKTTVRFLTYGDRTYNATVTKILPTADPATQRYVVYLAVDIDLEKLVPGIYGEGLDHSRGARQSPACPTARRDGTEPLCGDSGRVEMRRVRLGYQGLNVVEILPDEQTGRTAVVEAELVIVEQFDRYRPGDRVRTETEN